jgi:hypothetical protein
LIIIVPQASVTAAADPEMTANPDSASKTTKLFSKIKTYLTGMHPMSVHLMGGCLMSVYLTGVYMMGVCLMGVYLTGVHLTGVCLMGIHFIGVHFMGVCLIPCTADTSCNQPCTAMFLLWVSHPEGKT